jgi:glycine cleavage system H protein
LLNRQVRISRQIKKSLDILTAASLKVPQGLFFSRYHAWTHLERSGLAKVGPDDFLMKVTGEVEVLNLKKEGEQVAKGDLLATIRQNGKALNLYSPISGSIVETNEEITKDPAMLHEDPYSHGWFYRIKPLNWISETSTYYLADDAIRWTEQEVVRLKEFLAAKMNETVPGTTPLILQDGGELFAEPLASLPDDIWNSFQSDFLGKSAHVPEIETYSHS